MIHILVFVSLTGFALSAIENANTGAMKYEPFNLPVPLNMSEDDMRVKDLSTFVRHHRNYLRVKQRPNDPEAQDIRHRLLELMKQEIYAAQDRVKHLEKVLDKYTGDAVFRLGFIFTKLDQLLDDLKRIYTIAVKDREIRNRFHVSYYEHAAKKNIDITYIVEYVIAFHTRIYNAAVDLENIEKESSNTNLQFE